MVCPKEQGLGFGFTSGPVLRNAQHKPVRFEPHFKSQCDLQISAILSISSPSSDLYLLPDYKIVKTIMQQKAKTQTAKHTMDESVDQTVSALTSGDCELSETLDQAYEQILKSIDKSNRGHAHRILQ